VTPVETSRAVDGMLVGDAMTHLVVALRADDSLLQAASVLASNRISGAPVVEDGKVVGVVSEADLIAGLAPPRRGRSSFAPQPLMMLLLRGSPPSATRDLRVGDVMTHRVISIRPDDSIWSAAELIDRHGVRRLPVVDDEGYVVGVLARSDLVRCMASAHPAPVAVPASA
jgi:CBS domain-containing protein